MGPGLGFVYDDTALKIDTALMRPPARPLSRDIGATLLTGARGFFEAEALGTRHGPYRAAIDLEAALDPFAPQIAQGEPT